MNFLQLIPISELEGPIRNLDTKAITKTPLPVYLLQYSIHGNEYKDYFVEAPISKYEIVLEMLWFKRTNLEID